MRTVNPRPSSSPYQRHLLSSFHLQAEVVQHHHVGAAWICELDVHEFDGPAKAIRSSACLGLRIDERLAVNDLEDTFRCGRGAGYIGEQHLGLHVEENLVNTCPGSWP